MISSEQRPIGSLKVPEFYLQVFGTPTQDDLQNIAERIQQDGFYLPIVIADQPDADGKYPVIKDVRVFLAIRDLLNYKVAETVSIAVDPSDQPMRMIFQEERRIITRRNLVNMFPIMEEYYQRVIKPTRPNNRDHQRDGRKWMSEQCKKLGCPIGLRNVEKLLYINSHRPSLLDLLGVDNPIHPVWKKVYDEIEGKEAPVGLPETSNNSDEPDQKSSQPDLNDNDESQNDTSPHGQEEAMKEYFGKQFCNPCRANWIWFNRINHIEPLEGGDL
jgi:hypothetical protein